jgi:Trk K+ transport system NAD-binding subunit
MRNSIVQLPAAPTGDERRNVRRAAIRQVDRAEVYIAAVEYMELGERESESVVRRVRTELDWLGKHLAAERSGTPE